MTGGHTADGGLPSPDPSLAARWFRPTLLALLAAGLLLRIGYLLAQPQVDPWHSRPAFDGAYYLDWARGILAGGAGPDGAFYLAPLYPHLLALFLGVAGERLALLYLIQQLLAVGAAALIAIRIRRFSGELGALFAAALFLFYTPVVFFASCPLSETVALFLLFWAVGEAGREGVWAGARSGVISAAAALARPNLLLVPIFWAIGDCACGRFKRAAYTGLGVALVLLPVGLRNLVVSGHPVLISSNSGLTAYHGNGPGALGVYTAAAGFSGDPLRQRNEATLLARARSGSELDQVEADRWWGRQAARTRLEKPGETMALLARRAVMSLDSYEYGLDYAPELDQNPWRPALRPWRDIELPLVPLGLLIGLSLAALVLVGFRGSGGWTVWSALAACIAAPLLFYVSSRYRLPFSALLVIPAGCGLAALVGPERAGRARSRRVALAILLAALVLSWLVPFGDLKAELEGEGLSNRAVAHHRNGNLDADRGDAERAILLAPRSARVKFNAGVIAAAAGQHDRAVALYRESLALDPGMAESAGNLASLLIERGQAAAAVPILRRALSGRPSSELCWNNLVAAHLESGDAMGAAAAVDDAGRHGITLDPALVAEVRRRNQR